MPSIVAAVAGLRAQPHMALADDRDVDEPVRRQHEHRDRGCPSRTAPPRSRSAMRAGVAPAAVSVASMASDSAARASVAAAASSASMKARKVETPPGPSVTPAAIAWPPPLARIPASTAARNGTAEIDAEHGTARAGAGGSGGVPAAVAHETCALERDGEGRPPELFAQPARR